MPPVEQNKRAPAPAKAALRKLLRQRRNALSAAEQAQAAADLAAQLQTVPAFARARRIAFYVAHDGEIDPAQALAWALARGKKCYAPVIIAGDKTLRFAAITARAEFRANRFGIQEPVAAAEELLAGGDLDLALLPLVGFDRRGNRLGMGGGFYDATFAGGANDSIAKTAGAMPQLIGVAHEIQRVECIAADAWDIPLSAVVTDRRVYHCGDCAAAAENEFQPTANEERRCATG